MADEDGSQDVERVKSSASLKNSDPPPAYQPRKKKAPSYRGTLSHVASKLRAIGGDHLHGHEAPTRVEPVADDAPDKDTADVAKDTEIVSVTEDDSDDDDISCPPALACVCVVVIVLSMSIPIAMMVIGLQNKNDCVAERNIPTFLIVGGFFSILLCGCCACVVPLIAKSMNDDDDGPVLWWVCGIILGVITLVFLVIWYLPGAVWVYGAHEPNYEDPTDSDYCEETLYLLAFWLLNIVAIVGLLIGLILVVSLCIVYVCS